ncbi:MAG TPA: ATP-binding protein [Steroidobacteraceae bacterium]|nr:ATP-binding protein [Steroidobacteraceae bacterium]
MERVLAGEQPYTGSLTPGVLAAPLPEVASNFTDRELESTLRDLLGELPIVLWRIDLDLRFRSLNGAVHELLGCDPQRLIGHAVREVCPDAPLGAQLETLARGVLSTRRPARFDFSIEAPSGRRYLQAQLFPEADGPSALHGIIGIVSDWSDRKRTQDELQASEERYRALIAQVKNYAIFALDLEGSARTWNEGVERVLGWSREEFIGLPMEMLFAPEDVAAGVHRQELQRAAEEGSATNDRWLRRKDGTPIYASGMTSRVVDAAGHVVGFSKVLRDRTAWKMAQDERDQLLESERKARQEAEAANRLKDEFLATLSHELRSPLNAIVGWVHVLRRYGEASPEIVRGLQVIERNARTQTQIINDLLDMSRIMTGKVHLNLRAVSLQRLVSAALEAIRPAAEAKSLVLEMQLDPGCDRIRGDPNRLQQVIWNLLTNAVKFTPSGGRVTVSSQCIDSQIEISVHDTGVGIPAAFLPFVFDRFRQADASTTRLYGGLGLGLSIVKSLVELHAGTVRAKSPGEGHGATFIVSLPLPLEQGIESPQSPAMSSAAYALDSLPKLAGIAVLCVDDEADSLMFCGRLLEDRGARVLLAVDAQQALETLRTERVDILISDIGMPNEDGYYLVTQLRALADARSARIPAIAVTAYARAEDRQRLLLAGYQMHISKPIEPQELIAGIASLVGVTAANRSHRD